MLTLNKKKNTSHVHKISCGDSIDTTQSSQCMHLNENIVNNKILKNCQL